jgi:hypothetical protein
MSWGTELWVSSLSPLFLLQLYAGDPWSLGDGSIHTLRGNSFLSYEAKLLLYFVASLTQVNAKYCTRSQGGYTY